MAWPEVLALISTLAALALGGFVWTRDWRAGLNRAFGMAMGASALVTFAHVALSRPLSPGAWEAWVRLGWSAETVQVFLWLGFGVLLMGKPVRSLSPGWRALLLALGGGTLLFAGAAWWAWFSLPLPEHGAYRLTPWGYSAHLFRLLASVAVLLTLENAYRASNREGRWRIKYLVLGLGILLAFGIYQDSQDLLFLTEHHEGFLARALVLLMACGLMAYSLTRHRLMGVDVFVSRYVIYNSITVMAVGAYLLLVGGVGWLIRQYGGRFHTVLLEAFLFLALMGMMAVLLSEQVRRRVKVFVDKHFYRNKYDYRVQWVAFTQRLSGKTTVPEIAQAILEGVVDILGVRNGALWLREDGADAPFRCVGMLGKHVSRDAPPPPPELVRFLEQTGWVFNARDPRGVPQQSAILEAAGPFLRASHAELAVPIATGSSLFGILTLGESLGRNTYNYEDYDLLKTVARQAATSLMHARLSESAAAAREAEAFRRTASFVMHDLKNQASMLSLVLQNAAEHLHDPAFQEDLMRTLGSTVEKMRGLIARLQGPGREPELNRQPVEMAGFIRQVLDDGRLQGLRNRLVVENEARGRLVSMDRQQMATVLVNLLLNAVEASPADRPIRIRTLGEKGWVVLEVVDQGCGMSREFLERSLFKPFQTTKPKGLGIGMYQCKTIVEAHGGTIRVTSQEGRGTTVSVRLPALQEHDRAGLGMTGALGETVR